MNTRYYRQIPLLGKGEEGQEKLRNARVLIVGLGGLGCPIALYLAAAGVGHLGLMDDDTVSLSNLHRQILYNEADIGKSKANCAAIHLRTRNSDIHIVDYPVRLTAENCEHFICNYDLIIDGCDNYTTRYLISDACHQHYKPYLYAAIGATEGQVAILCYNEDAPNYRTLFPDENNMLKIAPQKEVIGTTPAVIGSLVANEALKLITGIGEPLLGQLFSINLLTMQTHIISLQT